MSRIGSAPITIPSGVDVNLDGRSISVKGPKGVLERELPGGIAIDVDGFWEGDRQIARCQRGEVEVTARTWQRRRSRSASHTTEQKTLNRNRVEGERILDAEGGTWS